ncbi:arylsulfatase B-like [Nylanderia fulva]|uniref:arylsulfatase B-like n=1 Tax=Nylanderia fulva TaxID=613905 RepID=UPI0010FBB9BD|nr:arylsulfatase B-like [Nylanderia fulva]
MMCSTTIRYGIFVLCFVVLFATTLGLYETAPHIIVVMADDLGWNDVSFHGSDQIPTPNIDALGYNGIILNRHYVLPSSTPSRTAFFTGQYPIRLGMQGEGIQGGEPRGIPLNVRLLPEYLRGLGYTTKLIGKWHLGYYTLQHTPLHRGFDSFLGFYNSHVSYYDYKYSFQNMSGYDMHRGDAPAYGSSDKYVTDLFTDEAIRIIQYHESSRPLYLQISHLAVHAPVESPHDYNNYDRQFIHIREINRRNYARTVSRLDNSVGRIVQALGSRGMLKDSLILFLTDNGAASIGKFRNYGSNYPLRGMKYTLYEGGVRGIAVLWSPRLHKTARVCDDLMHVTDWLPTLYSIAGGNVKDLGEIDGVNQWCMLNGSLPSARDKILLNIDEISKTEGAIYKQFKLVRGSIEGGHYDGHYSHDINSNNFERFSPYEPRKSIQEDTPYIYTDIVLKSVVSESIARHLGDPVTQPSTMIQLRSEATVNCKPNKNYSFLTCNVTECLFDINNDPCEMKNIAEQYSRISRELDQFLEQYGRIIKRQIKIPIDWQADPRRTNNTWEPWLISNSEHEMMILNNSAAQLANLMYCVHIAIILVTITCNSFI